MNRATLRACLAWAALLAVLYLFAVAATAYIFKIIWLGDLKAAFYTLEFWSSTVLAFIVFLGLYFYEERALAR